MNNFINLPSGRTVQIDDIIYVSEVKQRSTYGAYFKVTWSSRISESFSYNSEQEANEDHNALLNILTSQNYNIQIKPDIICS